MPAPTNQAAWLIEADTPLQVDDAPLPTAGPGELVVKNAAIAINPLDCHMQDSGVFVQQWPAILGCDVAGEVYEVGPDAQRFKTGDRVIGHAINLVSGRPQDGAFALYTVIPADKAAILPDAISFTDGVVVPFALEAAVCALSLKVPGVAMPGVSTPAFGLPYPSLQHPVPSSGKTLVVYGGSSSVGSMTTQLATAAGIDVISIAGAHNFDFSKRCGAAQVFDHKDPLVADKVIEAVGKSGQNEFVGIFDAIATPETYAHDLAILAKLGGGHLACVHPPPADVPVNVKAGMIFAINDVTTPVWKDYVTPALQAGKLQCLPPPTVIGKGLEHIQDALKKSKAGVSATKLVVEL
ncbi:chaperonin 10-like protein [Lipomyces tetrasporus]|uniref:Chaperonin 10-like protein n=1 Tax=Lipomyces tetrasporus TaxID=54092 RepID=A0AAD7QK11_9ASCO|nr:chaperonin 10-like protein [Lipomyces tetrasporus]KAJ8096449.1 chaperonin 10-like protein [Lipomyces tetrasporus]